MTRYLAFVVSSALIAAGGWAQLPTIPADVPATGFIAGQVVEANTGRGLAESIVTLSGAGAASGPAAISAADRVITDSQGRFFFAGLPRGPYRLGVIKPGYRGGGAWQTTVRGAGQVIDLGDGDRVTGLRLLAWKHASISGRVTDEAGEPIVSTEVGVWRSLEGGRRLTTVLNGAMTDDRGIYRIGELDPAASYIVGVPSIATFIPAALADQFLRSGDTSPAELQQAMASVAPALNPATADSARRLGDFIVVGQPRLSASTAPVGDAPTHATYRTIFYPRATAAAGAEVITLQAGEQRIGIDFSLRPVPVVSVTGTLNSPGGPVEPAPIQLLVDDDQDTPRGGTGLIATTVADPTGRFTFPRVPSGRYLLRAWKEPPESVPAGADAPTWSARVPLVVGDQPIANLRVDLARGYRFSGRVVTAPDETPLTRRLEALLESGGDYWLPTEVMVASDGTFRSREIPPGRFRFTLPLPANWHVKSVMYKGRELADVPFQLESDMLDLVVTISSRGAEVSGSIMSGTTPLMGARVIIFPAEPREWEQVSAYARRIRETASGRDGRYTLGNLPAGEYFIVAGDADLVTWDRPNLLEGLSRVATRIKLAESERRSLDLRPQAAR